MAHAKYSPSSSGSWSACVAYVPLSESEPRSSSVYADEGTIGHAMVSGWRKNKFVKGFPLTQLESLVADVEVGDKIAKTLSGLDYDVEIKPALFDAVHVAKQYSFAFPPDSVYFVDTAVPLHGITGEQNAFGTLDLGVVTPTHLVILDDKFGAGVKVSPFENTQLIMYALGFIDFITPFVDVPDQIILTIHQPKVDEEPQEWETTREELESWRIILQTAVTASEHPNARFNPTPGAKQCRFCPAKLKCPATKQAITESHIEFNGAPLDMLADRYSRVALLRSYCDEIELQLRTALLNGKLVPGYKLITGREGNRAWGDPITVMGHLDSWSVKTKDYLSEPTLLSPAQLEKKLGKKSKEWLDVEPLIVRAPANPAIAKAGDPGTLYPVASNVDKFPSAAT